MGRLDNNRQKLYVIYAYLICIHTFSNVYSVAALHLLPSAIILIRPVRPPGKLRLDINE